jgi:hypothetical protein
VAPERFAALLRHLAETEAETEASATLARELGLNEGTGEKR